MAVEASQRGIFQDREAADRSRYLEGTADAHTVYFMRWNAPDFLTVQKDRTCIRLQRTRKHFENRALARSIRPDQAEDFALLKLKMDVVDRCEATEVLRQSPVQPALPHPRSVARQHANYFA